MGLFKNKILEFLNSKGNEISYQNQIIDIFCTTFKERKAVIQTFVFQMRTRGFKRFYLVDVFSK